MSMSRAMIRKAALAAMLFVTVGAVAWSLRASAEPRRHAAARVEGTVATEEKGKEQAAEEEGPASINWEDFSSATPPFIAMVINFGILAAGYYLLGRKPIAAALQSRRDTIAKDIEEAQRMRAEAEERAKIYQAKLEKLEEEVELAREGLVKAGEAERDRLLLEAEAKAERLRRDTEFLVEQELKQVRVDLLRETVEAAVAAAEQLLRSRVTAADQERIADDYLADLGAKKPPVTDVGQRQTT
jgi:F0F1-type ATP synthase membrane subunit b/b'